MSSEILKPIFRKRYVITQKWNPCFSPTQMNVYKEEFQKHFARRCQGKRFLEKRSKYFHRCFSDESKCQNTRSVLHLFRVFSKISKHEKEKRGHVRIMNVNMVPLPNQFSLFQGVQTMKMKSSTNTQLIQFAPKVRMTAAK